MTAPLAKPDCQLRRRPRDRAVPCLTSFTARRHEVLRAQIYGAYSEHLGVVSQHTDERGCACDLHRPLLHVFASRLSRKSGEPSSQRSIPAAPVSRSAKRLGAGASAGQWQGRPCAARREEYSGSGGLASALLRGDG